MDIDYKSLRLDNFTCSRKTKETSFREHFLDGDRGFVSSETSFPFRVTEQDTGLSFSGTAAFVKGRLSHLTLYLVNENEGQGLGALFYKAVRRSFFHLDSPFRYRRIYHYCGIRRYLKLLFLAGWTAFFFVLSSGRTEQAHTVEQEGYHVYETGYRYAFTEEKKDYEEGLQRAVQRDLEAAPYAIESYYAEADG